MAKRASDARNAIRRDNLRHRTLHHAADQLLGLLAPHQLGPSEMRSDSVRMWRAALERLRKAVAATKRRWLTMPELVALAEVVLREDRASVVDALRHAVSRGHVASRKCSGCKGIVRALRRA